MLRLQSEAISPFLLACPFFVLCTLGILLFFSSQIKRKSTMQLFGLYLIIRALIYFSVAGCYYSPASFQVFIESINGFSLLLLEPVLFFGFLSFIFPFNLIIKRCWFLLLPAAILGSLYMIFYWSYPYSMQQEISLLFWISPSVESYGLIFYLQSIVLIVLNVLSILYLLLYVKVLIFEFPKYLKDNFSNKSQLKMKWTLYVGILFFIFEILYLLIPFIGNATIIVLMILEIVFGFFIFWALNDRYRIKADLLESYFISFLLSKNKLFLLDILFPEKILSGYNISEDEVTTNKTEYLYRKLITYFEDEKPYLNKDLSLDDIARGLNTNRTYISQLLTKEKSISFYDFVNGYRIEEAKQKMLLQPFIGLKYVAEECGFNSYTTFIKYFEKNELSSPNVWKIKNTTSDFESEKKVSNYIE